MRRSDIKQLRRRLWSLGYTIIAFSMMLYARVEGTPAERRDPVNCFLGAFLAGFLWPATVLARLLYRLFE